MPSRCSATAAPASAMASATAEPRPPIVVWFSTLSTARHPRIAVRIVCVSSGLMTGTLSVVATTPCSPRVRSEEHTSELQSLRHLVCRLLLEKKKKILTYDLADLFVSLSATTD